MNFEEFKKYVDETLENIYLKLNEEEKTFISDLVTKFNQKCEENEDFKKDKESLNKCGFANAIQLLLAYAGLQEENMYLKKENQSLKEKYNQALSILAEYSPPCELDGFMDKNVDYCSMNCGVDEEIFKECWNRYIEQKLGEKNE